MAADAGLLLTVRVAVGGTLLVLGGLVATINWWSIGASLRRKRRVSPVPLLGAMFLGGGLLALEPTRAYAWLAIPLDYGTLAILLALPMVLREEWRTSRVNLVLELRGSDSKHQDVQLLLFRGRVAVLREQFAQRSAVPGPISRSRVGTWARIGSTVSFQFPSCGGDLMPIEGDPSGAMRVAVRPAEEPGSSGADLANLELRPIRGNLEDTRPWS